MKKINIDFYRLLASFMIVAIHIYPLANISEDMDYTFTRILFRIAVPFFLLITGYFILPKALEKKEKLEEYTLKIGKLYLISMLIYFPINIYSGNLSNMGVFTFFKEIFINGTFYHLWYFPALILGIWITYWIIKNIKYPIIIFSILYVIGLFGDSYYGLCSDIPMLKDCYSFIFTIFEYTRNGLFYVPIFLFIGFSIFNNKDKLSNENSFLYLVIFSISMMAEGTLLYKYSIPRHTSMYFFLIPTTYFLGKIFLLSPCETNLKFRKISTWLYILHPFFLVMVRMLAKILHLENIMVKNSFILYFLVIISTSLFIDITLKTIEKIKRL